MKVHKIKDFYKGWFIGNFEPSLIKTNDVEVGYKQYKEGDAEGIHYHKIATEITILIEGEVVMNDVHYYPGDIIVIEPNESTNFYCLTDVKTLVVKFPGPNDDKYECEI